MSNIISFRLAKTAYGDCKHRNVTIDEHLWKIECADCGAVLDPIAYLVALAKDEAYAEYRVSKLEAYITTLERRIRTKCQHCGKMTRI